MGGPWGVGPGEDPERGGSWGWILRGVDPAEDPGRVGCGRDGPGVELRPGGRPWEGRTPGGEDPRGEDPGRGDYAGGVSPGEDPGEGSVLGDGEENLPGGRMGGRDSTLWGVCGGPPGEERILRWQTTLFGEGEPPLRDGGVRQNCWF